MVPKVDTLSPIHLIPGGIVLIGVSALGVAIFVAFGIPLHLQDAAKVPVAVATIFLAIGSVIAYVIGYAVWGFVGGARENGSFSQQENLYINCAMCRYVTWCEPLRLALILAFRRTGYASVARLFEALHRRIGRDDMAIPIKPNPITGASAAKKTRLSRNYRSLRSLEQKIKWIMQAGLGREACRLKLVMLLWDAVYERGNANFIGRMISSWNNYKFAVATEYSLALSFILSSMGALILGLMAFCGGTSDASVDRLLLWMWCVIALVLFLAYNKSIRKWRARIFARDVVYGLRGSKFGGLEREDKPGIAQEDFLDD